MVAKEEFNLDPKEKLCRLYFILDGDIKKILNYEEYEEWSDYLKKFELKLYASGPTLESTMYSKENIDITTIDIIFLYDLNKTGLEKIIFNYLEFLIAKYPDMQIFFCNNGRTMEERFGYLMLFKERLINLIGIERLKKLEMKYPEILRIDFMEKNVTISYYEQYVQHPLNSSISIEAIKSLNTRFLLGKITYQYSVIDKNFEENNYYLYNIFKERLDWAINKAYHEFKGVFYSDEKLCFMVEFIKILEKCMKVISSSEQRERLRKHFIGALLKVDKLETILNKIAIQIISFIRWIDIENKNIKDLTINTISDYVQEKYDKILINVNERKEFLEWRQLIVANEFYEELGINNEIMLENDHENRKIFKEEIKSKLKEKPPTTTKAKLSKKKRDQEKKKNLELKILGKKPVEEISDNKMEEIEGEGLTSSQPKIINENTISKSLGVNTISEDLEEEEGKLEGAKIEEQKPAEKPIMKHLENKVTKSSKGKGKRNVNKNIKAKAGKKDKIEEINKIIKKENELTTNELTVFEENNELIDVLTEKKHWKNLRKSNFIIDRIVSLEEAIADIKKIVELWNKNAFTLISGSYLLNINSVESDVDFIVVLPFNYNDNNGKFVTKIMLDDEFMGIRSECNFDKREECSEKKSLYCVLCEQHHGLEKLQRVDDNSNNKQKIEEHLENELEPISITEEPIIILEETNKSIEELREAIDWNETRERESRNKLYINNNEYDQFLAIVCTYNPTNEYGDEFCDFSTTRIRLQLLFSIETEIDAICHANLQKPIRDKKQCPKEFRKKGWVCIIWLVGIDFEINGKDKNISSQNLVNIS
uniref:Polymerase nucleotidyl transferase domain-containing protein n=1 Tax=Meloidogyne javanica TaxID=6303 RepID=A0A915MJ08_MELJA